MMSGRMSGGLAIHATGENLLLRILTSRLNDR